MGARFIAKTIKGSNGISNLVIQNDTEFSFDFESSDNQIKHYKAYSPTRDDYEVSIAVIDNALNNGFNLIVYDHWIFATHSGKDYAGIQRIPIFSVPEFIKAIKTRMKLDSE